MACGILVSLPRIEHMPPALKVQSLNHWAARQVPRVPFCFVCVWWCLKSVRLLVWLNNDMVDTSEDQENKTGTEMSWFIFVPTKQKIILIANRHQVLTICWELFLSFFAYHNLFYPPNKWCALTRSCAEVKRKQSVAVNSLSLWAGQIFKITFLPPPAPPAPAPPKVVIFLVKPWRCSRSSLSASLERRWEGCDRPLSWTLRNGRNLNLDLPVLCRSVSPAPWQVHSPFYTH